jgi:hypothetical protein
MPDEEKSTERDATSVEGGGATELGPPDDGVDVTLIRWTLGLTPAERLDVLQRNVNAILDLRDKLGAD